MIALALGALAAGCASGIDYGKLPSDSDPSKEIDTLTTQMSQARKDQVDVYAPVTFKKAEETFADAQMARQRDKTNEDILDDVAKSRAYLERAKEHAQRAQNMLGEVYIARTRAATAGAPEFSDSRQQYVNADTRLYDFVRDADQGEMPKNADKTRVELLSAFQEAELKAIQQKRLGHARQLVQAARDEGAQDLAPKSLAAAEAKLAQGVATIKRDRNNESAILAVSDEASRAAEHLMAVTREAKGSLHKKPEDIAAARVGDRAAMEGIQKEYKDLQTSHTGLQRATKLTDTVRMIQAKFAEDEADVFEDGKQVHVRLKGLKFPSGSATIQTSAYPLLSKMQGILKDADPEAVKIEGRTDSKGSAEKNRELSKKRAEAVKEFLAANNTIEPEKVTTEGLGYQKPVAGNKTSEGRAMNRGVDVSFVPAGVKAAQDAQAAGQTSGEQSTQQAGELSAPNPESTAAPGPAPDAVE